MDDVCRRYALVSFLTWLPAGLMIAPLVLLMLDRGLTIVQVGVVMTVYSLVIAGLELPTGGLADVVGRRVVLAASAACTALALVLLAVAGTWWAFTVAGAVLGVARALSSGPAEAWFVDTLHAVEGPGADLRPGLSRGHVMEDVALGVGVLAGGFLPLAAEAAGMDSGVGTGVGTGMEAGMGTGMGTGMAGAGWLDPLALPALLGAVAALVWLVVVLIAMPEPPRPPASVAVVLRGVPVTVAAGVRVAVHDGPLRRLVLVAAVVGMALTCIELLVPGHLAELTGSGEGGATAYAIVSALGFAGSALGSALAPTLARHLTPTRPATTALPATTGLPATVPDPATAADAATAPGPVTAAHCPAGGPASATADPASAVRRGTEAGDGTAAQDSAATRSAELAGDGGAAQDSAVTRRAELAGGGAAAQDSAATRSAELAGDGGAARGGAAAPDGGETREGEPAGKGGAAPEGGTVRGGDMGRGTSQGTVRGSVRGAVGGLLVAAVALGGLGGAAAVGMGGVAGVVLAGVPYVGFFVGLGAYGVLRAELAHHRVGSDERATVASASSLAGSGGAALANLTLAPLAMGLGAGAAWWVVAAVVLAAAAGFARLPGRAPKA
ncbi:MFS transporter [Nonomuraea sp. NPDC049725]|uniref:MFS transporter n=1 Tax=Nonomuraea sp. NPDC049725 TaxID=3154508 RepID=UPI0034131F49